jgi:hypothetical protein
VVVQQTEQLELARLEVVRGVGVAQSTHGVVAEKGQQQPRTGPTLFEETGGAGGCFRGHNKNVAIGIIE